MPYIYLLLAISAFSLTLPMSDIAVMELSPFWTGPGRAWVALIFSLLFLTVARVAPPPPRIWPRLLVVGMGAFMIFPWITAHILLDQQTGPLAVMMAGLPFITALVARLGYGERPAGRFWLYALMGTSLLVYFQGTQHGGFQWTMIHLKVAAAVLAVAWAYAEGAALSRSMPSWQVISWGGLSITPLLLALSLYHGLPPRPSWSAGLAYLYLGLISQWLAFIPWYHGLALIGTAKASQIQQLQLFLTLAASAWLLRENISTTTMAYAAVVSIFVLLCNRVRYSKEKNHA